MKLWVALVAAALVAAGCGAESPPEDPTPSPSPPSKFWGGLWGVGEGRGNVTARPLLQKLKWLASELGARAKTLGSRLQEEATGARDRAAEYGAEARAALEQSWGDLKNRGAAYARKFRKRLQRDGEELRRRWEAWGEAWEEGAAALRRGWGAPWGGEAQKLDG